MVCAISSNALISFSESEPSKYVPCVSFARSSILLASLDELTENNITPDSRLLASAVTAS